MHAFSLPVFEIATRSAEPDLFEIYFGVPRDQIVVELEHCLEDPDFVSAMTLNISWNIEFIDEGGAIVWKATKLAAGEAGATLGAIPMSVEAYLIAERLLAECGDEVILVPGVVAISGALAAKGEFLIRPTVEILPGEYENPVFDIAEFYQQADADTCAIMSGFAMGEDGRWVPAHWLVKPDRAVIAVDTPHLHYFGMRLSPEAAAAFIQIHDPDEDEEEDEDA